MKKALGLMGLAVLILGLVVASAPAATDYYEFSKIASSGAYDAASFGDKIYVRTGMNTVRIYSVSISDMTKRDEPIMLADGVTANPNYQARTFTDLGTVTLSGAPGALRTVSVGELYVDATGIYTGGGAGSTGWGGSQIYKFDPTTGAYIGQVVTNTAYAGYYGGPSHLAYGDGKWWLGNENREVYSSTGGDWTYEFTYSATAGGSHGDGLEYVGGNVWASDMTSNFLERWGYGDNPETAAIETGWNEWNRFAYDEIGGTNEYVEGMGFGAIGHFWASSGSSIYELGGGNLGTYIPPPPPPPTGVPEPGTMMLLGSGLVGLVGIGRKKFFTRG